MAYFRVLYQNFLGEIEKN